MTLAHLVFALATTAYIVLAIQFEERDLVAEHGARVRGVPAATFRCYCRGVGRCRRAEPADATDGNADSRIGALAAHAARWRRRSSSRARRTQNGRSSRRSITQAARTRRSRTSEFVKVVREATERFRDVSVAEAEGYALLFGCVSGPDWGAMGLHYVNFPLVGDGVLDPTRPEIVIYEPMPNGRLKLTGADYLVLAEAWHAKQRCPAGAWRTALHCLRPQSLRAAGLLHAARVGVEGEPQRRVRQLAPQGVVRRVHTAPVRRAIVDDTSAGRCNSKGLSLRAGRAPTRLRVSRYGGQAKSRRCVRRARFFAVARVCRSACTLEPLVRAARTAAG